MIFHRILKKIVTLLLIILFSSSSYVKAETTNSFQDFYTQAHEYLIKGDYDKAIENYIKAINSTPKVFEYHFELAFAYQNKGQVTKAIEEYQEAVKLNYKNPDVHYNLGTALISNKQLDEAINEFKKVIELSPKHINAYNNIGIALIRQGNIGEALKYYEKANELFPDNRNIREGLNRVKELKQRLNTNITDSTTLPNSFPTPNLKLAPDFTNSFLTTPTPIPTATPTPTPIPDSNSKMFKLDLMLQNKLFLDPTLILDMKKDSESMSYEYRMLLYNKYEKNAGLGFGLNLLLISLGSWVIGDYTGASITDLGFLLGIACLGATNLGNGGYNYDQKIRVNTTFAVVAGVILTGTWIYNLFAPFGYAEDCNNKLRNSLNLPIPDHNNLQYSSDKDGSYSSSIPLDTIKLDFLLFNF